MEVSLHIYTYISEMESFGGFRDRSLVFASFLKILRRFGQSFASLPIQGHFGSSPVQIFRQSNLNSKLNFGQIHVVISQLSIYDVYTFLLICVSLIVCLNWLTGVVIYCCEDWWYNIMAIAMNSYVTVYIALTNNTLINKPL